MMPRDLPPPPGVHCCGHPSGRQRVARTFLLRRHRRSETFFIDLEIALRRQLSREVDWKAERVVQQEGIGPRDQLRVLGDDSLEPLHALIESALESRGFLVDTDSDAVLLGNQIWISVNTYSADIMNERTDRRPHWQLT